MEGQSDSFLAIKSGVSQTISNRNSQIILISGLIGAGIASKQEKSFQAKIEGRGLIPDRLAKVGDYWGISGQFLLWGSLLKNKEQSNLFDYATNAFIANGIITYGLKFGIGKERPDRSNTRSFPSGHTSNSFLTATVAREIYGDKVGVPAYIMACVTGLSRIHDNKHFVSDVIFGAALGTAVGMGFGKSYKKDLNLKFSAIPGPNQSQIKIVWNF